MLPGANLEAGFELLENRMATSQPWFGYGTSLCRRPCGKGKEGDYSRSDFCTKLCIEDRIQSFKGLSIDRVPHRHFHSQ